MKVLLTCYKPIVTTPEGRKAIENYKIPPFVDGSIRREPDFELPNPTITSLCRRKLAAGLDVEDKIVYLTTKHNYFGKPSHKRLTAILKVIKICESHREAEDWYRINSRRLPYNLMLRGNREVPIEKSAGLKWLDKKFRISSRSSWNAMYRTRVLDQQRVAICKRCFLCLHDPPVIKDELLKEIFGSCHGPQNYKRIDKEFGSLISKIGISPTC